MSLARSVTLPAGTLTMWKTPLSFAIAPSLVPSTNTVTPGNGCLLSLSRTTPVIVPVVAARANPAVTTTHTSATDAARRNRFLDRRFMAIHSSPDSGDAASKAGSVLLSCGGRDDHDDAGGRNCRRSKLSRPLKGDTSQSFES